MHRKKQTDEVYGREEGKASKLGRKLWDQRALCDFLQEQAEVSVRELHVPMKHLITNMILYDDKGEYKGMCSQRSSFSCSHILVFPALNVLVLSTRQKITFSCFFCVLAKCLFDFWGGPARDTPKARQEHMISTFRLISLKEEMIY